MSLAAPTAPPHCSYSRPAWNLGETVAEMAAKQTEEGLSPRT
jgi:hypothetical protein